MKKHIAILTQLAPFRRHLEIYPSTMQRDRSAYTTWSTRKPTSFWREKRDTVVISVRGFAKML